MGRRLEDILKEYLTIHGDGGFHNMRRYYLLAKKGLNDLSWDLTAELKTCNLTLDADNTIHLPEGIIKLVNVYIVDLSGRKRYLTTDRNIAVEACTENYVSGGRPIYPYSSNVRNGQLTGGMYGIGGNNLIGTYSVQGDILQVSSDFGWSSIYIDYIGRMELIDGDFMVHDFLEEPLFAWIYWKDFGSNKEFPENKKIAAEQAYYRRKREAAKRLSPLSYQEIVHGMKKGNKQAPKA